LKRFNKASLCAERHSRPATAPLTPVPPVPPKPTPTGAACGGGGGLRRGAPPAGPQVITSPSHRRSLRHLRCGGSCRRGSHAAHFRCSAPCVGPPCTIDEPLGGSTCSVTASGGRNSTTVCSGRSAAARASRQGTGCQATNLPRRTPPSHSTHTCRGLPPRQRVSVPPERSRPRDVRTKKVIGTLLAVASRARLPTWRTLQALENLEP
jgi:hypothetical protein